LILSGHTVLVSLCIAWPGSQAYLSVILGSPILSFPKDLLLPLVSSADARTSQVLRLLVVCSHLAAFLGMWKTL
jgi:hypothetical protein